MEGRYLEKEIAYTGRELRSHWAYERFDLMGDSLVAFVGPCDVPLDRMADLEDVKARAPIRSDRMLHLIAEHFGADLETSILRQRLLVCLAAEQINGRLGQIRIARRGDDLFDGEAKLSVSIAVATPVSTMVHLGLNVTRAGAPVRVVGLEDLGVDPRWLGEEIMRHYLEELAGVARARCKVRGVP